MWWHHCLTASQTVQSCQIIPENLHESTSALLIHVPFDQPCLLKLLSLLLLCFFCKILKVVNSGSNNITKGKSATWDLHTQLRPSDKLGQLDVCAGYLYIYLPFFWDSSQLFGIFLDSICLFSSTQLGNVNRFNSTSTMDASELLMIFSTDRKCLKGGSIMYWNKKPSLRTEERQLELRFPWLLFWIIELSIELNFEIFFDKVYLFKVDESWSQINNSED